MNDLTDKPAPQGAEPTSQLIVVHPGDVVQITQPDHRLHRGLAIVWECHGWGIGVSVMAAQGSQVVEAYERLKPGQFAVIGGAALMPPEVARARQISIESAKPAPPPLVTHKRGEWKAAACPRTMRAGDKVTDDWAEVDCPSCLSLPANPA